MNIKVTVGNEELRRSYSICTAPAEHRLAICIKRVAGGRFSNWANDHLGAGMSLQVMTPTGRFFTPLSTAHRKVYLAFAAGVGITPIISMAKAILFEEPHSRFILCYGNRSVDSIVFREDIEDLKNRYMDRFSRHHVISGEHQDLDIYHGRIDGAKAATLYRSFATSLRVAECYVCGPATMIDDVVTALGGAGMPREHIHVERFGVVRTAARPGLASTRRDTAPDDCEVTVIMNGRRRQFHAAKDGPGLVDAAARHGIVLPFSCKGGVCSTCRTKLVAGEVRMETNYALEPWELAAGYVLACQARPVSRRVTLDYDQA